MNAELIAVGTEILLGEIVNTDAQTISKGLSELGINVFYQTVVGDNPDRLRQVIETARDRADIIITTGGLGPTLDDLTKETLAAVFGKKMALHQPSLDRIRDFFDAIGREMTPNNEKQAWLPEGCTVFVNEWGTAPGCAFEAGGKHVLMLPGPPRECDPMWQACAMPYLYPLAGGCIVSHNVRVFGLGESNMETILHDKMAESQNPTIAPYAKTSECYVRITAKADTPEACETLLAPVVEEVCGILGEDVYGVDADSLEQVVGDGLRERGLTLPWRKAARAVCSPSASRISRAARITTSAGCAATPIRSRPACWAYRSRRSTRSVRFRPRSPRRWRRAWQRRSARISAWASRASQVPTAARRKSPSGWCTSAYGIGGENITRKMQSANGRDRIRMQAASTALDMIRRNIL